MFTVVLWKSAPGQSILQSYKRGVGAPSSVSTSNHERVPMSCLQQLVALQAGLTITYSRVTSGFKVKSWWNTTPWTQTTPCEHSLVHGAHHISYVCLRKSAFIVTKFLTSNKHSAGGYASQTPGMHTINTMLQGGHSFQYTLTQKRKWAKSRGCALQQY